MKHLSLYILISVFYSIAAISDDAQIDSKKQRFSSELKSIQKLYPIIRTGEQDARYSGNEIAKKAWFWHWVEKSSPDMIDYIIGKELPKDENLAEAFHELRKKFYDLKHGPSKHKELKKFAIKKFDETFIEPASKKVGYHTFRLIAGLLKEKMAYEKKLTQLSECSKKNKRLISIIQELKYVSELRSVDRFNKILGALQRHSAFLRSCGI